MARAFADTIERGAAAEGVTAFPGAAAFHAQGRRPDLMRFAVRPIRYGRCGRLVLTISLPRGLPWPR